MSQTPFKEQSVLAQKGQCLLVMAPDGNICLIPMTERTARLLRMAMDSDSDEFHAAGLAISVSSDFGQALKDAVDYMEAIPPQIPTPQTQQ